MAERDPENYALIGHPTEPRVLLLHTASGCTLPGHTATEAPEIDRAMRELLAVDVTMLGTVYDRARFEPEARHRVHALEMHTLDWVPPPEAAWISREALRDLPLAVPEHRAVLDAWFAERESGIVPPLRAPWALPGWHDTATAWTHEQAERLGYHLTGPFEQVRVRNWSSVMRVSSVHGPLYFKATTPGCFEVPVTMALAERWPDALPPLLAADPARGWLLMADGGVILREILYADPDPSHWEAMLMTFARLQIASAPHVSALHAAGCPDHRLRALPRLYAELLQDADALMVDRLGGLTAAELERARALIPEVEMLCARLASYGLPATIHQDDFGASNILVGRRGEHLFFDWGEAAIAHPLFALFIPLRWSRILLNYDAAQLDRLLAAYLEPWTAFASEGRLREAFPLAHRLAKLARALSWHEGLAEIEPDVRWENAESVPYFLRMFLNDDEGEE